MPVARLMELRENTDGSWEVRVRWRGPGEDGDKFEPLQNVYEDVPIMLQSFLRRKQIPSNLRSNAKAFLNIK